MIPITRLAAALSVLAVVLLACGSSGTSSATCDELANSASDQVAQAITKHAGCKVDSDCGSAERGAQCFQGCDAAMNVDGAADVAAAKAAVNGAQCKQFAAQGCQPNAAPPCPGPPPPSCKAGVCQ